MGNFISSLFKDEATGKSVVNRLSVAGSRLSKLISTGWSVGGTVVWTVVTAGVVLAVPIFFEYERECQLFDQMQAAQAAQMAVDQVSHGM